MPKAQSARTGREVARDARRQQYIDAAATVFCRYGYDTATLGDLADILGVTRAAMYYYVHSKEDLLYEIIREMHMLNVANLEEALDRPGTPFQRLRAYFAGHAHINLEFIEKATVVYRDLDHLPPERRAEIVSLRDQTQSFVRDLLVAAVDDGTVCSLVDVDLMSIQMFATVNAAYMWYRPEGRASVERLAGSVADFVLGAVACTGGDDRSCPRHHPASVVRTE